MPGTGVRSFAPQVYQTVHLTGFKVMLLDGKGKINLGYRLQASQRRTELGEEQHKFDIVDNFRSQIAVIWNKNFKNKGGN